MKDKEEQIPEYLLRLMVLRILDSQYPLPMQYKALEKLMEMKANCFPRELARVITYLEEKEYVKGLSSDDFDNLLPTWINVKITVEGIDYLESLEEEIKLEVEKKEKELGIGFQS